MDTILIYAKIWMDLKNMLRDKAQKLHLYEIPEKAKLK